MHEFDDILTGTPWWVYLLFLYLLRAGILATKVRVRPLKKLFILPTVLLFMSLHNLGASINANAYSLITFIIAMLIGGIAGFIQIYRLSIAVDKKHHLIKVPGTWSTMILILIVFVSKYYFGFELAVQPALVHQTTFLLHMLIVSGLCTGLFVGRLICYLVRFYSLGHTDLKH